MELSPDIYTNFERAVPPERRRLAAHKWEHIFQCYRESHRYYHNWQHIRECHDLLLKWEGEIAKVTDNREVFLAVVYHDIVYEIGTSDNEVRSAEYFQKDAYELGLDDSTIRNVYRLILDSTYSEGRSKSIFGDIDLSGLAAAPEVFREKSDLIRNEYASIPEEVYLRGRIDLMKRFLASQKIYCSELFGEFENQARDNLSREIEYCECRLRELGYVLP